MGDTPTATYEKVRMTKGEKSCSRTLLFGWPKLFRDGEERLAGKDGQVRKRKNDAALMTLFADRRQTVLELAELFNVTAGREHSIMIKELKLYIKYV